MSVKTVCLGWHWRPYEYSRIAVDVNGSRVLDGCGLATGRINITMRVMGLND